MRESHSVSMDRSFWRRVFPVRKLQGQPQEMAQLSLEYILHPNQRGVCQTPSHPSFHSNIHNTVISAHCSDSFSPLSFPRLLVNLLMQFLTLYFIIILSFFGFFCTIVNSLIHHSTAFHRSTALSALEWNCKITILCTVLLFYVLAI